MIDSENNLRHRRQMAMNDAARWFSKMQLSANSIELEEEFKAWLEEDPAHSLAYEQCKTIWMMTDELQHDEDIQREIINTREFANLNNGDEGSLYSKFVHRLAPQIAMIAAVLLLFFGALYTALSPDKYETNIGEQRLVVLPDGSTAMLNTDTQISYRYNDEKRSIFMPKGEAIFNVKSDKNRAFEVHPTVGVVRAVGTEFNVAIQEDEVEVTVLEGVVAIEIDRNDQHAKSALTEISIGQAVRCDLDGKLSAIKNVDLERVSAWRDGKIYFKSDKLADAIDEYNRYTTKRIILNSDKLKEEMITGVFQIGDTESFLFALKQTFDISVVNREKQILISEKHGSLNKKSKSI